MDISISPIPGEAAVVAVANMITALAEGQDAPTKKELWTRYLEITEPWHKLAVAFSVDAAGLVARLLPPNAK